MGAPSVANSSTPNGSNGLGLLVHTPHEGTPENGSEEVPFINPIRDGWLGPQIAEALNISAPFSRQDLCNFFELQLRIYDETHPPDSAPAHATLPVAGGSTGRGFTKSKTSPEIDAFVARRVDAGLPSGAIRAEVSQHFGVNLSASHMSHMRRRLMGALSKRDNL